MEHLVSRLGRFWVAVPAALVIAAWVASGLIFWPGGEDETAAAAARASDVAESVDVTEDPPAIQSDNQAGVDHLDSDETRPTIPLLTDPEATSDEGGTDDADAGDDSNPDTDDDVNTDAPATAPEQTNADADNQDEADPDVTTTTAPANNTSETTTTTLVQRVDQVDQTATTTTTTTTTTTAAPPAEPDTIETSSPRGRLTGVSLFADPTNSAAQWAANNPNDPRAAVIASRIGDQPIARWFGEWSGDITSAVSNYVNDAAAANSIPMLVVYNIPDRDCGQHSAGGAASFQEYDAWIASLAAGLGDGPAIIILEPDAIALNGCAGSGRNIALNNAVNTIKNACGQCRVYLDAGHSNWVSPTDMASRLTSAGIAHADGFSTNISNYNLSADEAAYGAQVLAALGNPTGIGQVIDASRNGNGSNGEWCDPPGRAIGANPTVSTGVAHVHAYLWIKVPGEADGCIAAAGDFVPDQAAALANNRS